VRRIGELHAAGKSLRQIAETLTEEKKKPRRGKRWHPECLRRIVARLPETERRTA
jgi:hypothetical protein